MKKDSVKSSPAATGRGSPSFNWDRWIPRHRPRGMTGDQGFVLLEVMLAVAMLMGGVVAVLQSYRSSLTLFQQSRERFEGALWMESQLAEFELTGRINPALATESALSAVSWADLERGSDPLAGTEHEVSLKWGEGRRVNGLEQSVYVWK